MTEDSGDVLFVDVETTGLRTEDRVVSLGLVRVGGEALRDGAFSATFGHFIFNPGRPSDPRARKVHGYSDDLLADQQSFTELAAEIYPWFDGASLIAAHNASFDRRFVVAEFDAAKRPLQRTDMHCTMRAFKEKTGGRGGLDVALETIGLARKGKTHGALEDAWLAANVHYWTVGHPLPPKNDAAFFPPTNLRKRGSGSHTEVPAVETKSAWNERQRESLAVEVRPTALMMSYLARCDGLDTTEVSVMADFVETWRERLDLPSSEADVQDIAAEFFLSSPADSDLSGLAAEIMDKPRQKSELLGWLKSIGYADGKMSGEESAAVKHITEAVRAALSR